MSPLGLGEDRPQEMVIEHMREGPVSQVMAETRNTHIVDILLGDL